MGAFFQIKALRETYLPISPNYLHILPGFSPNKRFWGALAPSLPTPVSRSGTKSFHSMPMCTIVEARRQVSESK